MSKQEYDKRTAKNRAAIAKHNAIATLAKILNERRIK